MIRISPALEQTAVNAYHLMGVRLMALGEGRDWILGESLTQPNGSQFLVIGPDEGLRDFRAYLLNKYPRLTLTANGSVEEDSGDGDSFVFAKDFESSGESAAFDVLAGTDHTHYQHRNENLYVFLDGKLVTRLEHNSSGDWASVKRHVEKALEGKSGYITIRQSTDPQSSKLGEWNQARGEESKPQTAPRPAPPPPPAPGATHDVLLNGRRVTSFVTPVTYDHNALNALALSALQDMKTPLFDGDITTVRRMDMTLATGFVGDKASFFVTLGDGITKKVTVPKGAPLEELGYALNAPNNSVVTYRRFDQTKYGSFIHSNTRAGFKVDNGGIYPREFKAPRRDHDAIVAKAWETCGGKTQFPGGYILIKAEEPGTAFTYGVWTRVGEKK